MASGSEQGSWGIWRARPCQTVGLMGEDAYEDNYP